MFIFPFTVCPSPPSSLLVFFPHFLSLPFLSSSLSPLPSVSFSYSLSFPLYFFSLSRFTSLFFPLRFLSLSLSSSFPLPLPFLFFLSLSFCLFLSPSASLPRLAWTYSPACKAKQQNRSSTSHKIFIHLEDLRAATAQSAWTLGQRRLQKLGATFIEGRGGGR